MVDPENLSASARMHMKWLCVRKSLSAVRGEDAPVLLLHVTASSYKLACLESELAFQNWDLDDCRDNHNDTCRHPQCARCYCISQGMCPQLLALVFSGYSVTVQRFDGMASTFASLLDPSLLDGRVAVCSPRRCY